MTVADEYIYLGDRNTHAALKNQACRAVRRKDGKCIRGRNGAMLVQFGNGKSEIVIGRLLRKIKTPAMQTGEARAPERS